MSYDGNERFVFTPWPSGASMRTLALAVLPDADPGDGDADDADGNADDADARPALRLSYRFGFGETHPVPLTALDAIVDLPWRREKVGDREVRGLAPGAIAAAMRSCRAAARDLDKLARVIARAVNRDGDDHAELRRFLDDASALKDPNDADTDERRLAQLFAWLVRGLRLAEKERSGLLVVRLEQGS